MTNWTARIALIAYILGGWLLPATHHHVGHARHAKVGNQHSTDVHHGCEHQSCCHEVAETDVPNARASSVEAEPGQTAGCCSGLCALCLARTLASEPVSIDLESVSDCVAGARMAMASQSIPSRQPLSSISSRGPPIIL